LDPGSQAGKGNPAEDHHDQGNEEDEEEKEF